MREVDGILWEDYGDGFEPLAYPESFYETPSWWQKNCNPDSEAFDAFCYAVVTPRDDKWHWETGLAGRSGGKEFEGEVDAFDEAARAAFKSIHDEFVVETGKFYGVDAMR